MTAVISRLNLNKTKLEKKPDYEEILNVINPDVKVQIPNRKSSDYFKSHFNITYGSLSDEKVKQMEHQLLLEKFKNQHGFNKAAVDALLYANNLSAVSEYGTAQSPDTQAQALDDFGGDPAGGGGGIGTRTLQRIANIATKYVGAAIRPETVRDYINSFLGGPNPSPPLDAGAVSYNIGTPGQGAQPSQFLFQQQSTPMRSFLLFGSESARMSQIEGGDYRPLTAAERQYLIDIYKFQNAQPIIPAASDLFTAEQPTQPINPQNLEGAFNQAASSSSPAAQPAAQPASTASAAEREVEQMLGAKDVDADEEVDDKFFVAIVELENKAIGIEVKGKTAAQRNIANKMKQLVRKINLSSKSYEDKFIEIKESETYKEFKNLDDYKNMNEQARDDYEKLIYSDWKTANAQERKSLTRYRHIKDIINKLRQRELTLQQQAAQIVGETGATTSKRGKSVPIGRRTGGAMLGAAGYTSGTSGGSIPQS